MTQNSLNDIREHAIWYKKTSKEHHHPTESEVSNLLVTPLLKTLGWPPKNISYERAVSRTTGTAGRIDIALHHSNNRKDSNDILGIIEVKKHHQLQKAEHIHRAKEQVAAYAPEFPELKLAIITDGYKYYLYRRNEMKTLDEMAVLDILESTDEEFSSYLAYSKLCADVK